MASVSDAEIQAFVDSKVSSHKQIKGGIEFRSAIPKNNMGKILRRELRVEYAKYQDSNELMDRIFSAVDSTAKKLSELWNCNFFLTNICMYYAAMQNNATF